MTTATVNKNTVSTPATVEKDAAAAARRAARVKARRERQKAERARRFQMRLYRLICWLELLPRRVGEATTTFFSCGIVLMLFAAAFFAAMGLLMMALSFWASYIPGWGI